MSTWQKLRDNPSLFPRYFLREKVNREIRRFFEKEKFHEVETPTLISNPPAESYLDVFETQLLNRSRARTPAYLSTSPEVPLKKLLVAGIGNCYALTKSFRNMETQGTLHNPEFTILEWYRVGTDYLGTMNDCEHLISGIYTALFNKSVLSYQGHEISLVMPWTRIKVSEAFERYAGIHFDDFLDGEKARNIARHKGYSVENNTTWEELYNQIFLNEIESHLGKGKPTILYDFPASTAALCRRKQTDPRFKERFELYIGGLELADAYSELTDWREQEKEFEKELSEIKRLGKTSYEFDRDFLEALKAGLPDSSGVALGVDRLLMLFADVTDIADILFFPAGDMFGV